MGTANWIKTLPNPITSRKDTFRVDYFLGKSRLSFMGSQLYLPGRPAIRGHIRHGSGPVQHPLVPSQQAGRLLRNNTTISPNKINDFTMSGAADRAQLDPYVGVKASTVCRAANTESTFRISFLAAR